MSANISGQGPQFIVLEGIDGAGTTTQARLLAEALERAGRPVLLTWEPTDGPIGRLIRSLLSGDRRPDAATLALLFAADRNDHIHAPSDGIRAHLERGTTVVCDRYTISSLVYQGSFGDRERVAQLNESFPRPDLVVFLDTPRDVAERRLASRTERDHLEQTNVQDEIAIAYEREIARYREDGGRVIVARGSGDVASIHHEICAALGVEPAPRPADR